LKYASRLWGWPFTGVLVALLAASPPSIAQSVSPPPTAWISPLARDHVLAGKVWSRHRAHLITHEDLIRALMATPLVLLGEVHDNADAHALQGWAVLQIISLRQQMAGALPAGGLVSEHIRTDQRDALVRFEDFSRTARRPATVHDLFRFLDWKTSGWPSEDIFLPLFQSVLRSRLPIYPANPPREQVRAVARGDSSALSADDRARLELDTPLDAPLADALTVELKASHCGLLPDAAIPSMSSAQRYRDAAFADAMLTAAAAHGAAILVAGNGHVRTDRAVPWYLRQRAPDRTVASVMMLEAEDGQTDPAAYAPRSPDGKPAVDFIMFTPAAQRPDPCESLRQRQKG